MGTNLGYIMTLANGIIGVSILAMPFCFKQCGIVLSILMLLTSSVISRCACHFLLKSAILARRRTFEILAFHAFGSAGKFFVEIGIIGFLLGTCIAFFVVVGDLGPAIISNVFALETSVDTLRSTVMITVALFCVLPLGLLRDVESLSSVCTATVGFYFCLVIKIILEALPHILFGDWVTKVAFWRPAGILQCIPIFSMALFCQTQLFEIFETIPNASLDSMNAVVRGAVNICTAVYVFVGVFGYIAFCGKPFSGNILMSFTPSITTDIIKIGFVLSVAFSFPVVIFPCRASLHSLLFRKGQLPQDTSYVSYIPETRFRWLTVLIVAISLITGLLIPSIELVLGLVGSTIGVMICVLFPATCFICVTTKNTNERILAQIMLTFGILIMVLGTYANFNAIEDVVSVPTTVIPKTEALIQDIKLEPMVFNKEFMQNEIIKEPDRIIPASVLEDMKLTLEKNKIIYNKTKLDPEPEKIQQINEKFQSELSPNEIRHEPPQPIEPDEHVQISNDQPKEPPPPPKETQTNPPEIKPPSETSKPIEVKNELKKDEMNKDAIKKEEIEIAEEAKNDVSTPNAALELMEKFKEESKKQEKILEEAKQVLAEIKEQKQELERKQQIGELEKQKAALEIQKIANIAIESLAAKPLVTTEKPENKTKVKNGTQIGLKLLPLPLAKIVNQTVVAKVEEKRVEEVKVVDIVSEIVEKKENVPENKVESMVMKKEEEYEIPKRDILSNDETTKSSGKLNKTEGTVVPVESLRVKRDVERNEAHCDLGKSDDKNFKIKK